jgi:hypothetical protein
MSTLKTYLRFAIEERSPRPLRKIQARNAALVYALWKLQNDR